MMINSKGCPFLYLVPVNSSTIFWMFGFTQTCMTILTRMKFKINQQVCQTNSDQVTGLSYSWHFKLCSIDNSLVRKEAEGMNSGSEIMNLTACAAKPDVGCSLSYQSVLNRNLYLHGVDLEMVQFSFHFTLLTSR